VLEGAGFPVSPTEPVFVEASVVPVFEAGSPAVPVLEEAYCGVCFFFASGGI